MAKFTLAQLDVEKPKDPFEYEASTGETIEFTDPKTRSAEDILAGLQLLRSDPAGAVRLMLGVEAMNKLLALPETDAYFLEALMKKYSEHFGLPVGQGNPLASLLS